MTRPPDLWEAGCEADPIRNLFVIPFLETVTNLVGPSSVIDIGCGTGYITRKVAEQFYDKPIQWRMLDKDPLMLEFAQSKCGSSKDKSYHLRNIEAASGGDEPLPSDLGFVAYSLLDIVLTENTVRHIAGLIAHHGLLLIFLPDVLEDVFQAASEMPKLLDQYLQGHCSITKQDKFTATNVIFEANRLETIMEYCLSTAFHILHLEKYTVREGRHHYCLVLRKSSIPFMHKGK